MSLAMRTKIASLGGLAIARKRGRKWMAKIGRKGGKS